MSVCRHDSDRHGNRRSNSPRRTRRRPWRGLRATSHPPRLELLESRVVLSPTIFTVDSTGSGTSGSGMSGTLPYVISQANANTNTDGSEIEFDSSVFNASSPQTIPLGATLVLTVTAGPVVIDGPGAGLVAVSGDNTSEVFNFEDGTVANMSGLSIIDGNGVFGGGLFNQGTLTITNTTFTGNSAAYGGAVYTRNGLLTLTNDTFTSNSATALSGAIDNWAGGTVTVTDDTFTGNCPPNGGAIGNEWGSVAVSNSTFSNNLASTGAGGAIINFNPSDYFSNSLSVVGSTISGNAAVTGGGIASAGPDTLSLTNDTIAGNSATGSGGGLYSTGTAMLTDCTISGNSAGESGGGVSNGPNGPSTITLTDTIVAGNTDSLGGPSDIGGAQASEVTGSFNLIGTGGSGGITDGSDGNIVLTSLANLGLAPLGNYGGPTETMALLPGSAAIGAGVAAGGVTTDQRGFPLDSPPDIGAFQSQGFTILAVTSSAATVAGAAFTNPLAVTVTALNPVEPVAGGVTSFTVNAAPNGASASLSATTAIIGPNGVAQVTATANSIPGSYTLNVSTAGAATPANITLTNLIALTFSGIASQSITYGTSSATFSGTLANAGQTPRGENVVVTLDGVATHTAVIGSSGTFPRRSTPPASTWPTRPGRSATPIPATGSSPPPARQARSRSRRQRPRSPGPAPPASPTAPHSHPASSTRHRPGRWAGSMDLSRDRSRTHPPRAPSWAPARDRPSRSRSRPRTRPITRPLPAPLVVRQVTRLDLTHTG